MGPSSRQQVRLVISTAKSLLLSSGWTQRKNKDAWGRRCLQGALMDAACYTRAGSNIVHIAGMTVYSAIARTGWNSKSIPEWNDWPERTLEEVIAVLDDALMLISPVVPTVMSDVPVVRTEERQEELLAV